MVFCEILYAPSLTLFLRIFNSYKPVWNVGLVDRRVSSLQPFLASAAGTLEFQEIILLICMTDCGWLRYGSMDLFVCVLFNGTSSLFRLLVSRTVEIKHTELVKDDLKLISFDNMNEDCWRISGWSFKVSQVWFTELVHRQPSNVNDRAFYSCRSSKIQD